MGKAIDATGQTFGRLTGIEKISGASPGSSSVWRWDCACGNLVDRPITAVKTGQTLSCGCLRKETTAQRKSVDVTGRVFYRLTVVGPTAERYFGNVVWECLCSCGNTTTAKTGALLRGLKRSCGCLQKESARQNAKARALPREIKLQNVQANRQRQRARRKADPMLAMQARLSRLHRLCLDRINAPKTSPTFEALGYSVQDFVRHIERQFLPGMGWHNMQDWQIDHITPSSSARTADDVMRLNQLSNLRPLWAEANNAKKNKRELLL